MRNDVKAAGRYELFGPAAAMRYAHFKMADDAGRAYSQRAAKGR
jgi:hypothetical protein